MLFSKHPMQHFHICRRQSFQRKVSIQELKFTLGDLKQYAKTHRGGTVLEKQQNQNKREKKVSKEELYKLCPYRNYLQAWNFHLL